MNNALKCIIGIVIIAIIIVAVSSFMGSNSTLSCDSFTINVPENYTEYLTTTNSIGLNCIDDAQNSGALTVEPLTGSSNLMSTPIGTADNEDYILVNSTTKNGCTVQLVEDNSTGDYSLYAEFTKDGTTYKIDKTYSAGGEINFDRDVNACFIIADSLEKK